MQKYTSLILRLWRLLKPFHKDFYTQLFLIVLQQAINILSIYILAKVLDAIIHKNFDQSIILVLLNLLFSLIRIIISYYTDIHAQNKIDFAIQQHLEQYSFTRIFNLNIFQYTEDHSAIKEQVINRGENAVEDIVSTIVLNLIPTGTQILFAIIAMSFYSRFVAVWSLVTLIVVIIWSNYFAKYHRPFIKNDIDNWDKQKKIRTESFQHLGLIRILGVEHIYLKKYLDNRQSFLDYKKFVWNKNIAHGNKRIGFFNVSRAISSLSIIYLAHAGTITAGSIYAIWSYITEANSQIMSVIRALRQMPLRFTELEKYLAVIDSKAEFKETGTTPPLTGDITVQNLKFSYPRTDLFLFDGISFTIPYGKKTAFVGSSGSGKSTIIKLLLRIYNYTDGSIMLGGNELKTINASHLRKHIGYVEQHVELFDASVKENILTGVDTHIENSEKKLEEVAQKARITEFYHRLGKEKFETLIGERGIKLSGGERQRVGIARAIIKNPDILIFDEATSSLDTENEKYVMDAIKEVSEGKTTIIIAHRLSTVRDADKIIVMDKGQVVGEGTHDELMQCNDVYKNLVSHQV